MTLPPGALTALTPSDRRGLGLRRWIYTTEPKEQPRGSGGLEQETGKRVYID